MFYLRSGDGIITELATITPYGYGGYCGKTDVSYGSKLTWDVPIDKTTLTIKGNGAMRDYDSHAPWSSYGFTYANIDAGVSSIGNNAFEDCDDMTLILVPDETTYAYFAENWTDAKRALLAPREIPMAMNSSHWVTYCHNYPVGYGLSQGLTAYTVNGLSDDGQSVGTTAVTTVYPGTPVLLSSNENLSLLTADPTKPATPATTDIVDNGGTSVVFYGNVSSEKKQHTTNGDGIPALTAKNGLADGWTCYALYNGVFQLIDTDGGISPNRCVLAVNTNGQAAARSLTIGEGTTSLREVNRERVKSEVWYALDGRKLNGRPTKKGLYINGGRKVVIK